MFAIGHESHAGDGMVVAVQGLDVCVFVERIPQFDGEVGGARHCMVSAERLYGTYP